MRKLMASGPAIKVRGYRRQIRFMYGLLHLCHLVNLFTSIRVY